ncbi:MAG: amidohydrolase [bacterium]
MSLLIVNARILPRPADPTVDALLIRDGRIRELGPSAALRARSPEATPLDAAGRYLCPGFQDAHFHFLQFARGLGRPWLGDCATRDDFRDATAAAVARHVGEAPLILEGWDETGWSTPERPTRADLDAISGERPIIARRVCGHVGVVNRAGLALLRERWSGPGIDDATGWLDEGPVVVLDNLLPPDQIEALEALERVGTVCHRLGITTATDYPHPNEVPLWPDLVPHLPLRVTVWIRHPADERHVAALPRTDRFRSCGIKIFSDGAIGGRTAALRTPYADRAGGTGQLVYEPARLRSMVRAEHDRGRSLAIHAIGDRAIEEVIGAYEALGEDLTARGHRIEHFELAAEDHLERVRELGVIASVQPNFLRWANEGGLYETALGAGRRDGMNRFGSILRGGGRICFGSDGMPAGPRFGIRLAATRNPAAERIDDETGIRLYTEAAADATPGAPCGGRLVPGEIADLVLMDDLPSRSARDDVDVTILDGRIVWSREPAANGDR